MSRIVLLESSSKQEAVTHFQGSNLHFTTKVKFTQSLRIQNPLFSETKSLIRRKIRPNPLTTHHLKSTIQWAGS